MLQDDLRTIIISELAQKVSKGLPRGELKLGTMIWGIYNSPFREGYAILFVAQNTVKFSSNRLDEFPISDFSILKNQKYSFRLNYEEIVFHIEWEQA